jgi:hypothetical protein
MDLRVGTLPDHVQAPLLGRAVGRVIAHEVGHWLTGRRHTRDGLMRATFRERDLIDWWSPRAPRDWTTSGSTHNESDRGCTAVETVVAAPQALAPISRR